MMANSRSLATVLLEQHERDMIHMAEVIRDWPEGVERTNQAEIHVRWALLESGMRISQETLYRVYSILSFVMPADAIYTDEATPDEVLERQAEWEIAYQEQLDQQSCPECGDGMCRP